MSHYVSLTIQCYTKLNDQTVLFLTIQFSISHLFAQLYLTHDKTLSSATTLGQSVPESDGNEGAFHIPQSTSFTEA